MRSARFVAAAASIGALGACAAIVGLEDKEAYPADAGDQDVPNLVDAPGDGPVDDGGVDVVATGELVASGQMGPSGVGLDSTYVYWTEETAGNIWRRTKDLSAPAELVANMQSAPRHILIDAQYIYWYNANKPPAQAGGVNTPVPVLVRAPLGGAVPEPTTPLYTNAGTQGYARFALYAGTSGPPDDTLYGVWNTVDRYSRSTPAASPLRCASSFNAPVAVAADVDFVWWVDQGTEQISRRLKTFTQTSKDPQPQPYGPPLGASVVDMCLDDSYLYLATQAGDVLGVPHGPSYDGGLGADAAVLDSGSDAAIDAGPLVNFGHVGATPAAMQSHAGRVYLTRFTTGADGVVVVLDTSDGGVNVAATGQRDPRDLAVDAPDGGPVTVYWTNHAEGTVRRVTVP
ncbi:MAG TPA: hypothetical protein VIF62_06530 [Labilithrix sp.]